MLVCRLFVVTVVSLLVLSSLLGYIIVVVVVIVVVLLVLSTLLSYIIVVIVTCLWSLLPLLLFYCYLLLVVFVVVCLFIVLFRCHGLFCCCEVDVTGIIVDSLVNSPFTNLWCMRGTKY